MALTGLQIFKLLPKTNCKDCGMPTCLAFAMALAQKKAKLDDCPHASDEAKSSLAEAAAPPIKLVKFGTGDAEVQVGQETVMFRHDEKFYNPTVIAVTVSDSLSGDELNQRIEQVNGLQFERVGQKIGVKAVAVLNESGNAEIFAAAAEAVKAKSTLAMILYTESADALAAAAGKVADAKPLLGVATTESAAAVGKIAKDNGCPVIAQADSVEGLADLTEKLKEAGVEDVVLSLKAPTLKEQLYGLSQIRAVALKKNFRPLGFPTISCVLEGAAAEQSAQVMAFSCKFSSIVLVETVEKFAILPILTSIMNIFTDPQKPVQVEAKLYEVGEPDENSPVLFTTNFSLTYYTVESDVEASRVPCYILVVDTEGTSVLTAYSGDKLNEKIVAAAIKKTDLENKVKHRTLIIPGYVAVMSGKLEEESGWEVKVGPRESSVLPKFMQEVV